MLIPIERLRPDSTPVRHHQWPEDDAALRASMEALGQLEPLLVVRLGDDFDEAPEYEVKNGNRRLAIAKALNWIALTVAELPRDKPDFTLAAATAANVVHAPLDAVDKWRAVVAMQARGYTLPAAAAALGLSERHARQLDRLGRLHPDMLALIEAHGMPSEYNLAIIAGAPPDMQQKAATAKGAVQTGWNNQPEVNWHNVQQLCARTRFPRSLAIFDVATAGLAWEQDVFAEPGSADEWTTGDVPGFLKAQRAALEVEAAASKGRLVLAEESVKIPGEPQLPKGWRATHGDAKKPKRGETIVATVSSRTGAVVRVTAIDVAAEKAREKKAKDKAQAKAAPAAPPQAAPTAADDDADDAPSNDEGGDGRHGDEDDEAPPVAPPPPEPKHPLTKGGQALLAASKTAALRARLRDRTAPISNDILVPLLILALHANNVEIRGYDHDRDDRNHGGADLVRRLVTPAGHLQFDAGELPYLAGEALARMLNVSHPDASRWTGDSGPTAEWIGAALDAQKYLPRLDTAELLATADAATLRAAATIAGEKFTTATAAKRDLPGKLPDWRPDFTHFGAPGPKPAAGRGA